MPKILYPIDINKLNTLKDEVCVKFGRNVAVHSDAIDLRASITTQIKLQVSTQTLKRVFGLINDATIPSIYTLNVLCMYIGYPDWKCYLDNKLSLKTNVMLKKSGVAIKDFYDKEIHEFWYNYYYSCRERAFEIYNEPETLEKEQLLVNLANIPAAQTPCFELFVNQDHLNNRSCKQGLKAYIKGKNTTEAILFGNSLLYLGAYLAENAIEANYYASNLSPVFDLTNVLPLPVIRRSLCLLMDSGWKGNDTTDLADIVIAECAELNSDLPAIPNAASMAIQHLLLAAMPDVAFKVYQQVQLYPKNSSEHPSHNLYLHSVKTLEALVLAWNGCIEQSFELFVTIDVSRYEFYFSKLYNSFYCILAMIHGDRNAYHKLKFLVHETGYKRLLKLVNLNMLLA